MSGSAAGSVPPGDSIGLGLPVATRTEQLARGVARVAGANQSWLSGVVALKDLDELLDDHRHYHRNMLARPSSGCGCNCVAPAWWGRCAGWGSASRGAWGRG